VALALADAADAAAALRVRVHSGWALRKQANARAAAQAQRSARMTAEWLAARSKLEVRFSDARARAGSAGHPRVNRAARSRRAL
jgi:hypothetical protein